MCQLYNSSDLFFIPSIQDNLPNTVLESLSCGTPVIGFDIGGIPEIVENDFNGFLFRLGDINAIAEYITLNINNENKLKILSANSRLTVENNFTLKKYAMNYSNLYNSII